MFEYHRNPATGNQKVDFWVCTSRGFLLSHCFAAHCYCFTVSFSVVKKNIESPRTGYWAWKEYVWCAGRTVKGWDFLASLLLQVPKEGKHKGNFAIQDNLPVGENLTHLTRISGFVFLLLISPFITPGNAMSSSSLSSSSIRSIGPASVILSLRRSSYKQTPNNTQNQTVKFGSYIKLATLKQDSGINKQDINTIW